MFNERGDIFDNLYKMSNISSPPFNFLLLDAASAGQRQDEALVLGAQYESFYKGDKEENRRASPYLFELRAGTPLAAWYFQHGWGQSWGVPVFASAPFEEVYRHFRKFLMVKTEDGEKLYFRFYDPRVLRTFLPTCDAAQVKEFFGPVKLFICEDVNEESLIVFSHFQGELKVDRFENSLNT